MEELHSYVERMKALEDCIREAVDCGCCTINESAVTMIAKWYEHLDMIPFTPEDLGNVLDLYLFFNYVTSYRAGQIEEK